MHFFLKSSLIALVFALLASGSAAETLLIADVRIVDPISESISEPTSVLIGGGKIIAIGRVSEPLPPGSRRIDGASAFLVPGLIDSHVHVGHLVGLSDDHFETRPDLVQAYRRQTPRSFLFFGFTTLIDLDLKAATRADFVGPESPELLGCGRGIRLYEGYGPSLLPAAIRYRAFPNWVANPGQKLPPEVDPSAHTPAAAVAQARSEGAICIKTYHESGFGGIFDWPTPQAPVLASLVAAARKAGLPLVLHATGEEAYRAGLLVGVDVLAHGIWHWPGDRLQAEPPAEVRKILGELARRGIAVQPTARVLLGEAETYRHATILDERFADAMPKVLVDFLKSGEGHWAQQALQKLYAEKRPDQDIPAERYLAAGEARVRNLLKILQELGVPLLFGSDTPASEGVGNPPGLNGRLEIEAWAAAGIPPAKILRAMTTDNARRFGLADRLGKIEVGKEADMLLLRKNPLQETSAYDTIEWVVVNGVPIERQQLSAKAAAPSAGQS